MIESIRNYFQEVLKELQKVSWPSREQLMDSTVVVVVAVLLISVIVFFADTAISWVLKMVYDFLA